MWLGLAIVLIVVIGISSSYFLGANNPVEKDLEAEAEELAEKQFRVVPGTFKPEFETLFDCTQKGHKKGFDCVEQPNASNP